MDRYTAPLPERFGDVPAYLGLILTCRHCHRPSAVQRDRALLKWGTAGIIAEVCERVRCPYCRKRGVSAQLAPHKAKLGSPAPIDRVVAIVQAIKPRGRVE